MMIIIKKLFGTNNQYKAQYLFDLMSPLFLEKMRERKVNTSLIEPCFEPLTKSLRTELTNHYTTIPP